jgi:hypothetical protein
MLNDVQCPYCGADNEICHDDGRGYDEGVLHQQECRRCEKTFVFETEICFSYTARKADCLNGAEHNWKETKTIPHCFRRLECVYCGAEKEIQGIEVERKAYWDKMEKERQEKRAEQEKERLAYKKEKKRIMKIINDANKAKGI